MLNKWSYQILCTLEIIWCILGCIIQCMAHQPTKCKYMLVKHPLRAMEYSSEKQLIVTMNLNKLLSSVPKNPTKTTISRTHHHNKPKSNPISNNRNTHKNLQSSISNSNWHSQQSTKKMKNKALQIIMEISKIKVKLYLMIMIFPQLDELLHDFYFLFFISLYCGRGEEGLLLFRKFILLVWGLGWVLFYCRFFLWKVVIVVRVT